MDRSNWNSLKFTHAVGKKHEQETGHKPKYSKWGFICWDCHDVVFGGPWICTRLVISNVFDEPESRDSYEILVEEG